MNKEKSHSDGRQDTTPQQWDYPRHGRSSCSSSLAYILTLPANLMGGGVSSSQPQNRSPGVSVIGK